MPLGANTNTNKQNGTQVIKKIKKICKKLSFPNPFKNKPNPRNPRI